MVLKRKRYFLLSIYILLALVLREVAVAEDLKGLKYILNCSECHGFDGNSTEEKWPSLAGLNSQYLQKQLLDFKSGHRINEEMNVVIQHIPTNKELQELADYFSSQTLVNLNTQKRIQRYSEVNLKLGEEIYRGKRMEYGIPGCESCHGKNGLGDVDGKYPRLKNQNMAYLVQQMKLFRSKDRDNDHPAMMRNIAMMMDDEDIESVAAYIALMSIQ